jgi:hypothetical protein
MGKKPPQDTRADDALKAFYALKAFRLVVFRLVVACL